MVDDFFTALRCMFDPNYVNYRVTKKNEHSYIKMWGTMKSRGQLQVVSDINMKVVLSMIILTFKFEIQRMLDSSGDFYFNGENIGLPVWNKISKRYIISIEVKFNIKLNLRRFEATVY